MRCTNCGIELSSGAGFCGSCGSPLTPTRFCSQCGSQLHAGAAFCGNCGARSGAGAPTSAAWSSPQGDARFGRKPGRLWLLLAGIPLLGWVLRHQAGWDHPWYVGTDYRHSSLPGWGWTGDSGSSGEGAGFVAAAEGESSGSWDDSGNSMDSSGDSGGD